MTLKPPEKRPYGLCGAIEWPSKEVWVTPAEAEALIASGCEVEAIGPLRQTGGKTYCRVWSPPRVIE